MSKELWIVGDFTLPKPFMVVEYFRSAKTKYVGHKIHGCFSTRKQAEEQLNAPTKGRKAH